MMESIKIETTGKYVFLFLLIVYVCICNFSIGNNIYKLKYNQQVFVVVENAEEDATSMKEKGCYFGYSDRDPNKINSHIKLHWNEMFAEPPLFQSLEPCWQFNKWIYTGCAKFGYISLATILGPFIACFYGMVFCFTTFTVCKYQ